MSIDFYRLASTWPAAAYFAAIAGLLAAADVLTIVPGALVIYFVRNYIAKGFALGRV